MMELHLAGMQSVRRAMTRAERALDKKLLRQDLRAAAKTVMPTVRELTPSATGRLRRSLAVRAVQRSRAFFGAQVLYLASKLDLSPGRIIYAHPLERGVKAGPRQRSGVRMMRRAFDATIGTVRSMMTTAVRGRFR